MNITHVLAAQAQFVIDVHDDVFSPIIYKPIIYKHMQTTLHVSR